jgi:uncharacterized protein (TIGR02231 family)
MKNLLLFMLLVSILPARAEDKPKTVKSKIRSATVFLKGADITSNAEVQLSAGANTLVFNNIASSINPQSIQVKGEGDFSILSVTHQINYLENQEKSKEVKLLQDSIEILNNDLEFQNSSLSVFIEEESMLLANKVIDGGQTGVKTTELREATAFFRERLTDIKSNQLKIKSKIKKIHIRLSILSNQLLSINSVASQPTSDIIVIVNADASVYAKFTISYFSTNAGWVPSYDLRAIDVNNPVDLVYKASVYQSTGFDWDNIKLVLSSSNPNQSGTKPELYPWYVAFYYSYYNQNDKSGKRTAKAESAAPSSDYEVSGAISQDAKTGADYTTIVENQINVEFNISIPYTINSDNKFNIIEVQKYKLTAQYEYFCAPKLDKTAFLLARITGWEQYNLLPGDMNLFFEGTFVGKSYTNTYNTKDTLDISLGRDNNIVITREKIKDFTATKFIGTSKKETYGYEISVRNKKKQSINIIVEDQLPISNDKDIEIEQLDISGANLDKDSGKLTWKLTIKPGETKKLRLAFSVKYPKDKTINL